MYIHIYVYICSYENPDDVPKDPRERRRWAMSRKATVELTQLVELFFAYIYIYGCICVQVC